MKPFEKMHTIPERACATEGRSEPSGVQRQRVPPVVHLPCMAYAEVAPTLAHARLSVRRPTCACSWCVETRLTSTLAAMLNLLEHECPYTTVAWTPINRCPPGREGLSRIVRGRATLHCTAVSADGCQR